MKKAIFLIPIIFIISSCGYSSFEECELREFQKCETKKCEIAVYSFCDTKFPTKFKWIESNNSVYFDEKITQLSIKRDDITRVYKLCLTHNDDKECSELTVYAKYMRNTDYGDFALSPDIFPNILNAKDVSEITYTLKTRIEYR